MRLQLPDPGPMPGPIPVNDPAPSVWPRLGEPPPEELPEPDGPPVRP